MEVIEYFHILRQRILLIIIVAVALGAGVYYWRNSQPPTYQAEATVLTGGFFRSPNPSEVEIQAGVQLAQTYSRLATTYTVLEAAAQAGNFGLSADDISNMVSVRVVPATSLVVISISNEDPQLAADIANELAVQLVANSPTGLTEEQLLQVEFANEEVEALRNDLERNRAQLEIIEVQISAETDPNEVEALRQQQELLINNISVASSTLEQFTNTIIELENQTNSLTIVEPARVPTTTTGLSPVVPAFLAFVLGAGMAVTAVLLFESLDNTAKSPAEVSHLLQTPVIGVIPTLGRFLGRTKNRLVTSAEPHGVITEAYRTARSNLFVPYGGRDKRIVVTSVSPGEGKSLTTANLAIVMAQANLHVLLVDANFRNPTLNEVFVADGYEGHPTLEQVFGISGFEGLGSLLQSDPKAPLEEKIALAATCIHDSDIPNLHILTTGEILPDPTSVFGSDMMNDWITLIEEHMEMDVILFDTPAASTASDSLVLAHTLHAPLLVVVQSGAAPYESLEQLRLQIHQFDVEMKGAILNAVPAKDHRFYSRNFRRSTLPGGGNGMR